jgi:hypothetical protein
MQLVDLCVEDLPTVTVSKRRLAGDFNEHDMRSVLKLVNGSSSPGYPWLFVANSKKDLIDNHCQEILDCVAARLEVLKRDDLPFNDPTELVKLNAVDPMRVFVKNEPHSRKKLIEERYRLILSVSVCDEVIMRMLCGAQNENEIALCSDLPVKPGIGFSLDSQVDKLCAAFAPFDDLMSSDVSGWDWSFKLWQYRFDVERRIRLAKAEGTVWARILHNHMLCMAMGLLITSDGTMIAQTQPGVMKSGMYNTSSTNSNCRVALARLVGAKRAFAMGDDCVESYVEDAEEIYRLYGFPLSEYQHCGKPGHQVVEFCSHKFIVDQNIAVPTNALKGVYNLLNQKPLDRGFVVEAYTYLRHWPGLVQLKAFINERTELGLPPSSH